MRNTKMLFVAVLLLAAVPASSAQAVVEWELKDDSVSLGMSGVSPHVEKTTGGDRVWRSDGPSGTVVSLCSEAGSCSAEALAANVGGPINDFTVALTPGGLRAYFVQVDPRTNSKGVYSAPCLTTDCLSIGAPTLASSEAQVALDQKAWGVPDPVRLPDGRIRIYLVESPVAGKCTEKIASYISSDGVGFTKEPGWRLEGGFVDTEMLRAKDGDWLMILADIGCTASRNQKLFASTSIDGLTWSQPQVLTGSGPSKLDPTGYEVSTNVFRIYYSETSSNDNFTIKRTTMRIKDTTSGGAVGITKAKPGKSKATTCVKGKVVRKVSGAKCPKGFKKK